MRLAGLLVLLFVIAVMSPKNPLASGGQAPASPPPTSANNCKPPVPGPDWVCQDGGWLPPGHPLIRPSGETPPTAPSPPTGGAGTPEPCISVQPGPSWICQDGGWLPAGHPLIRPPGETPPTAPSLPPVGVPPFKCTTSDPFAGVPGLFGLCIDGGWVPIGHPLASDYLERSLAIDYSGIYTLTLIADACTAEVSDVLKRRVYTARIEQNGATVHVFLSGADFWPGSNAFSGVVVSTDEIRFSIVSVSNFYYSSSFDVGEKIGAGTLIVDGIFNATTSIIGTRMNSASSGNEGIIYLDEASLVPGFDKNFFFPAIAWVCSISRFELTRQ